MPKPLKIQRANNPVDKLAHKLNRHTQVKKPKWTTKVGTRTKQENANQNYMTNCLIPGQKYCQQENKTKRRKTNTKTIDSDARRETLLYVIDSDVNYSSRHGN